MLYFSDAFWHFGSATRWSFTAWDQEADKTNVEGDMVNIEVPYCRVSKGYNAIQCRGTVVICQGLQCLCCCVVVPLCAMCGAPGLCDVYLEGLCAGKASVYLSKRINSSLLTKIFISWHWLGRM